MLKLSLQIFQWQTFSIIKKKPKPTEDDILMGKSNLAAETVMKLLKFCMKNSTFWKNTFYSVKQVVFQWIPDITNRYMFEK